MSRTDKNVLSALHAVEGRLRELEHAADLLKTVLVVREPETVHAANAYEGLRRQVVAAAGERRSHLAQLAAMAVAVSRATAVADLRPQVREWLDQAGVVELRELPPGTRAQDAFEEVGGGSLEGVAVLEVLEPAYLDGTTGTVLRLGRARAAAPSVQEPGAPAADAVDVVDEPARAGVEG